MIRSKIVHFFYKIKKHNTKEKSIIVEKKAGLSLNCFFEGKNRVCEYSFVSASSLGYGSYIGRGSKVISVKMGRYCSIGPNVSFTSGSHPSSVYVSTHPAFFSPRKQAGFTFTEKSLYDEYPTTDKYHTYVGNDVWIGEGATIIEGVHIGDGAIIAAGAVVTKDVPPYAIVAGVPAKVKKYRFEENEIDFLMSFKWWEKDPNWLAENIALFTDIKQFMKEYEE